MSMVVMIEGVGGDNGMEESVDSGKGGCISPGFIVYVYLVSPYSL
jgi:hypothetical protein